MLAGRKSLYVGKNGTIRRMATGKILGELFCYMNILGWLNQMGWDNLCCSAQTENKDGE